MDVGKSKIVCFGKKPMSHVPGNCNQTLGCLAPFLSRPV